MKLLNKDKPVFKKKNKFKNRFQSNFIKKKKLIKKISFKEN